MIDCIHSLLNEMSRSCSSGLNFDANIRRLESLRPRTKPSPSPAETRGERSSLLKAASRYKSKTSCGSFDAEKDRTSRILFRTSIGGRSDGNLPTSVKAKRNI